MESFSQNRWKLTSFDLFTLNMTIKGAWVYRTAPDYQKMREALAGILELYPHLSGRYDENEKSLLWDDGQAEPLPFSFCSLKTHSVEELVGNSKVWSLVKPYDLTAFKKGKIAPFSAVLAELRDGAVLFVQCAHATMDGATFYRLIGQWAALYKGEEVEKMTLDQSLIPAPDILTKEETIRQAEQKGWMKIMPKQLVKMLWCLVGNNMVKRPFSMKVSQEQLSEIREVSGVGTNAALTALTIKAFAEHHRSDRKYKLLFVADLRGRISGVGDGFFGNISQPVVAEGSFDPKMDTTLLSKAIEDSLHQTLSSGSAENNIILSQCSSHYGLPYFYFDPSDMNCPDPGTVYINNQLKFKACELDWGHGKPEYVFPNELTDMVKFWQPVSGGPIEIIFAGYAARLMRK